MAWRAFQSQHMGGGDYDPETEVLTIQFTNGAVYRYFRVPQTVADKLFQTGSSREYFNDHVKGVFAYAKVADGTTKSGRRSKRRY